MRLFQRVMQNNLVPLYDFCGTGGYRHERHTPNVFFFFFRNIRPMYDGMLLLG